MGTIKVTSQTLWIGSFCVVLVFHSNWACSYIFYVINIDVKNDLCYSDFKGGVITKALTLRVSDRLYKLLKHQLVEKDMTTQKYLLALVKRDLGFENEDVDISEEQ